MRMKISASDIIRMLERKYPVEKFLRIPECKMGSTWYKPMCSRFDMWVMARSWANPRFIGLEIKVTRQDFLRDKKWQNHLPYCTEFYFVSPPGIIDPGEVPEQTGLIVGTKNCKRLLIKKKAPVRDLEIPTSIFIYILMCRTRITEDTGRTRVDLWRDRLKEMKENKILGHTVAETLSCMVDQRVQEVIDENRKLRSINADLKKVQRCMDNMGLSPDDLRFGKRSIERQIKDAMIGIPFDLPQYLKEIEINAGRALKILNGKTL